MAGLGDREADGDLVKLTQELLLLHPELPVLELSQQRRLVPRLRPAPPLAPGRNLTSGGPLAAAPERRGGRAPRGSLRPLPSPEALWALVEGAPRSPSPLRGPSPGCVGDGGWAVPSCSPAQLRGASQCRPGSCAESRGPGGPRSATSSQAGHPAFCGRPQDARALVPSTKPASRGRLSAELAVCTQVPSGPRRGPAKHGPDGGPGCGIQANTRSSQLVAATRAPWPFPQQPGDPERSPAHTHPSLQGPCQHRRPQGF